MDIRGADKALLTVDELVNMFENAANKKFDDDRIMLGLRINALSLNVTLYKYDFYQDIKDPDFFE